MQISVFSFLMSVMWGNILAVLIHLCRKTHFFIYRYGITGLLLLYLLCALRIAVPIEFKDIKAVALKGAVSAFYHCVYIEKIGTSPVSVVGVLSLVWAFVAFVLLLRFGIQYGRAARRVRSFPIREDAQCRKALGQVRHGRRQVEIHVRCSGEVTIPASIGIFQKSIVLPEEDYPDEELYYILLHEYTHFLNRDLPIKMFLHILCCIFWWNPAMYLIRKDLGQLLEIRCDQCVTGQMDPEKRAGYLSAIVSVLKKAGIKKQHHLTAPLAFQDSREEILERFRIVSEDPPQEKNRAGKAVRLLLCSAAILLSYAVVIYPYYDTPIEEIETEPGVKELRPDNAYIVKDKNGTYTLIMPGVASQVIDGEAAARMETDGFEIVEEK